MKHKGFSPKLLHRMIAVMLVMLFLVGCEASSTTSASEAAAAATIAAAEATKASAKATEAAAVGEIARATKPTEVMKEMPTPTVSSPTSEPTETSAPTSTFTPGPSPTPTTESVGSLKGKILWATGEPRPGFEESFINQANENVEFTLITDINGEYQLDNIPAGKYEIGSYRPSGFGFYTPEYITVQEGKITEVPTRYFLKEDLEITSPTQYEEVSELSTVTWKSYPNAVFYEVVLRNTDDSTMRIEDHTQDSTFTIEDSLDPGQYSLTVSAFNSERKMSSKQIIFKVK